MSKDSGYEGEGPDWPYQGKEVLTTQEDELLEAFGAGFKKILIIIVLAIILILAISRH